MWRAEIQISCATTVTNFFQSWHENWDFGLQLSHKVKHQCRDVATSGLGVQQLPTLGTWENSGKVGLLHRQNQVIFEELKAT